MTISQQVQYLETLKSDQLLQSGRVKFLPFSADIPADVEEPKKAKTMEEEFNLDVAQIKS